MVLDQAARLDKPGRVEVADADDDRRAEDDAAGRAVRLADDGAGDPERRLADANFVADRRLEPRQQRRVEQRARPPQTLACGML